MHSFAYFLFFFFKEILLMMNPFHTLSFLEVPSNPVHGEANQSFFTPYQQLHIH